MVPFRLRASALSLLLLSAPAALARPGGGSSFSSSGSSSGSSSSSSWDDDDDDFGHGGGGAELHWEDVTSAARAVKGWLKSPVAFLGWLLVGLLAALPGVAGLVVATAPLNALAARRRGEEASVTSASYRAIGWGLALVALSVWLVLRGAAPAAWSGFALLALMAYGTLANALDPEPPAAKEEPQAPPAPTGAALLKSTDPGFSRVLLLDFVHALYTGLLYAQTGRDAAPLSFFATDGVLADIRSWRGEGRVEGLVIGSLSLAAASRDGEQDTVRVELEANHTLVPPDAPAERWVVKEAWTLARVTGAVSPPPDKMRVLSCPACGAPAEVTDAGRCKYCDAAVVRGTRQWQLVAVEHLSSERFSSEGLGQSAPEAGTDAPTLFHPALAAQQDAFASARGVEWAAFEQQFHAQTVLPTFTALYAAWSSLRWGDVRHLLGDRLWESQRFWMDAYAAQGLVNRTDEATCARVETACVERDRDVEAITVRIHASCKDFTVDGAGTVVGGSATATRSFTEYWTFLRSTAAPAGAGTTAHACPRCGAPLEKMGEAGTCGHCEAKVTTGEFSWVLAAITQDEVYRPA